ncbi:MAG: ThuA domain-containing protein [Planctomycetota bacterium]|nr:ThuA domain-containing protein [Planctomycetota bacterium]
MISPIVTSVLILTLCNSPLNPVASPSHWESDGVSTLAAGESTTLKGLTSILVYSRTTGFRHGSIGEGKKALKKLADKNGFNIEITEDPTAFSAEKLRQHEVVVFLNTTQDVLDATQESVFEDWIRSGGGYVGIHSASDTEYKWTFYGHMMGAYFSGHPRVQQATIEVKNRKHPATAHLPEKWVRTDEWYNFKEFPQHVDVLAYLDTDSYQGSSMKGKHPAAWCHSVDLGRAFYTVGGHTNESFSEPAFIQHLYGAIWWAAGNDALAPVKNPLQKKPAATARVGETG